MCSGVRTRYKVNAARFHSRASSILIPLLSKLFLQGDYWTLTVMTGSECLYPLVTDLFTKRSKTPIQHSMVSTNNWKMSHKGIHQQGEQSLQAWEKHCSEL